MYHPEEELIEAFASRAQYSSVSLFHFKAISERPEMRCIIRNPHNYYSWAKEEILSVDPRVSLVYDVITDREADRVKEMATPQVCREQRVQVKFKSFLSRS